MTGSDLGIITGIVIECMERSFLTRPMEGELTTNSIPAGEPDPFDDLVLDETFIAGAPKEDAADERIAKAARIARGNDRLAAAGEIADGSGKPAYGRLRRSTPWIAIGIAAAVVIIVVALLAR